MAEPIHPNCTACGRYKTAKHPFMPRFGTEPAQVLFIGQQPGWEEDRSGIPMVGESGELLEEAMDKAGFRGVACVTTNAARCGTKTPTPAEIKLCRPMIEQDLAEVNPVLTVLLGNVALTSAMKKGGIKKARGQALHADGRLFVPTIHPAYVLREPQNMVTLIQDLTFARRLLTEITGGASLDEKLGGRYRMVTTRKERDRLFRELRKHDVLSIDCEWEPKDWLDPNLRFLSIQFAWKPKHGIFLPIDHAESPWGLPKIQALIEANGYVVPQEAVELMADNAALKAELLDLLSQKQLVLQNAEGDIAVLWKQLGLHPSKAKVVVDTMTTSMLRYGPDVVHALKTRAYTECDCGGYEAKLERWLKEHPQPVEEQQAWLAAHPMATQLDGNDAAEHFGRIPMDVLALPYGCGDVDAAFQLAVKDVTVLKKQGKPWEFYQKLFRRSYRLDILLRDRGVTIDMAELEKRERHWELEMRRLRDAALEQPDIKSFAEQHYAATKRPFSLASEPQMRALLFDVFQLRPSGRMTDKKGDHSIDQTALWMILAENEGRPGVELVRALADYSWAETMLTRYSHGQRKFIWPDGKIHPRWHHFTTSGRRASSKPNIQNWPLGRSFGEDPKAMDNTRMLARATDGYTIVSADFAQLEWRLMACLSRDPVMIAGTKTKDADAHAAAAAKLKIPRKLAKTCNFSFAYKVGADTFVAKVRKETFGQTLWTVEKGQQIITDLWALYAGLEARVADAELRILRDGYIENILGHRRPLPKAFSSSDFEREAAVREGWNHEVQPVGHTMLDVALNWLQDQIEAQRLDWHLIIDAHDGFEMEVPIGEEGPAVALARYAMETVATSILPAGFMIVPFFAEFSVGQQLGALKKLKSNEGAST